MAKKDEKTDKQSAGEDQDIFSISQVDTNNIDPDTIDVFFGDVQMVQNGKGCGKEAEAKATKILQTPEFVIRIDLKMGDGQAAMLTCDFSIDYVKINADYRT